MPPDVSNTSQMVEDDPTNNLTSNWTDPNASSQSADAVAAFLKGLGKGLPQVEITTNMLGLTPKQTKVPHLTEFSRKRARASTPGLSAQEHTMSNWSTLMAKFVEVTRTEIQLPAKGRIAKNISIDVDKAADILVLVNAAFDCHQVDSSKQVLFKPAVSPDSSTRVAVPLLNLTLRPRVSLDFQAAAISEKLDVLTDSLHLLVSSQKGNHNQQGANKPKSSLTQLSRSSVAPLHTQPSRGSDAPILARYGPKSGPQA
ncbi:hypothetical protein DFH28DRAFT_1125320 [Melampsora americana]|nr:hypothetical protein DFH28DRAFT_1125320 [Melampsora americana]